MYEPLKISSHYRPGMCAAGSPIIVYNLTLKVCPHHDHIVVVIKGLRKKPDCLFVVKDISPRADRHHRYLSTIIVMMGWRLPTKPEYYESLESSGHHHHR